MRVHVVSDVHGNVDALARAGIGADALVVLGDLIDFVDYHDHSRGILGAIFGPETVAEFAELRRNHQGRAAGGYFRRLWESLDDPRAVIEDAIRTQYRTLFGALTVPTYATPGNVDLPRLWPEFAGDGVHLLDGTATEIGGLRFGFVGGGLLPPGGRLHPGAPWTPYLRTDGEFDAAVDGLPQIDVACSHVPPTVPELLYDVVARRPEHGSAAVARLIERDRPRWALFGHVHQPLASRVRWRGTECVNVGHFQRTERPYVLRW